MSKGKTRKWLRDKVDEISDMDWKIQELQELCEDMRLEVVEAMSESKASTGHRLRDFIILTRYGNFDLVAFQKYQKLIRLCQKRGGRQRVLIIQRSEYFSDEYEKMIALTNYHLTILRPCRPKFLLKTQQIKLPVERYGLSVFEIHHAETGEKNRLSALLDRTNLCIGPLEDTYSPVGPSRTDDSDQWLMSPADAVSTVIPLPISGPELLSEYGVDPEEMALFHRLWISERARIRRR